MNTIKLKFATLNMFCLMILGALSLSITSCTQEEDVQLLSSQNFSDSSIESLQRNAIGKSKCLEFIFPITIQFVDETVAEVSDYENLHETIVAWFTDNEVEKNRDNKPSLVFPIQVVNGEGEVIDVDSEESLKMLKKECIREGHGPKGQKGKGFHCFSLVFPVSLTIDGETQSFDDKASLKAALKEYKMTAGEDAERPELVYPVTIQYEDETEVEVESQEALQALKEACKEG